MVHYYARIGLFLCLAALPWIANGAAWVQQKGKGQFISHFTHYYSDRYFDANGDTQAGKTFSKAELSRYIEYGFDDTLTLGANPRLFSISTDGSLALDQFNRSQETNQSIDQLGLTLDMFYRTKLYEHQGFITSIQPLISLPQIDYNPVEGLQWRKDTHAIELRALAGYSFQWDKLPSYAAQKGYGGQWHFANAEVAYRRLGRFRPDVQDELKLDSTLGYRPNNDWLMMFQNFTTLGVKSLDDRGSIGFSKMQVSAVYHTTDKHSVQFSVFHDVWGRETGQGQGITIGLWAGF